MEYVIIYMHPDGSYAQLPRPPNYPRVNWFRTILHNPIWYIDAKRNCTGVKR